MCIYAILSFEYFVVHRVPEPYFSSSFLSVFVSSGFGSNFKIIIFFIITVVVNVVTIVLCDMCSILACKSAGADCKNRQLPKILIFV